MIQSLFKPCISCTEPKPLRAFYKHPQMADGHLNKCKDCCKRDSNAHRANNLERIKNYDRNRPNHLERTRQIREYSKTEEGRTISNAAKKAWVERNKHKKKAVEAVNNAVRDGRLIKPIECQLRRPGCIGGRIEGHHHDYSKPLDVWWCCDFCHKLIHKEEREEKRNTWQV